MNNLENQLNLKSETDECNNKQKRQSNIRSHSIEVLIRRLASSVSNSFNLSNFNEQRAKNEDVEKEFKEISF